MTDAMAAAAIVESASGTSSGRYRASEAAECKRKIWYRVSGYRGWPEDRNTKGMAFLGGNVAHDVTRNLMEQYGVKLDGLTFNEDGTIDEDDNVQKQFGAILLSSRADGRQGDSELVEIKSMGNWAFTALEKKYLQTDNATTVEYLKEKYPQYYAQTQVTMNLVGLSHVWLLPVDRGDFKIGLMGRDGKRHSLYYAYDAEEFAKREKRFQAVEKARVAAVPPLPEFADGSRECGWCAFWYLCHGAKQGLKHPAGGGE